MARYEYTCPNCDHSLTIERSIGAAAALVACPNCGAEMRKRFSMPFVSWGGMKPSQGTLHPSIRRLIDDAPRRRDAEHKP